MNGQPGAGAVTAPTGRRPVRQRLARVAMVLAVAFGVMWMHRHSHVDVMCAVTQSTARTGCGPPSLSMLSISRT